MESEEANKLSDKLNSDEMIIAEIPKDEIKSLFHLFVGRPDSEELVLDKLITLKKENINELFDKIKAKLNNHSINAINIKVDVNFEKGKTKQFGSLEAFNNYDWITTDVTNEIFIKIDFLVQLPRNKYPQRHTLSIRILSTPNMLRVLRSVFSADPEELDKISDMNGPTIVRVDFINNVLAKELLQIVKEWNECCPISFSENKIIKFLRKYPDINRYFFKYLTMLVMTLLSIAILFDLTSNLTDIQVMTVGIFKVFIIWSLFTVIGLTIFNEISKKIAEYSIRAFNKYNRKFMLFQLTKGDSEKFNELLQKNSKQIIKFAGGVFLNLLMNVIAGIIVYLLYSK